MARWPIGSLVVIAAGATAVGVGMHPVSALPLPRVQFSVAAAPRHAPAGILSSAGTDVLRGALTSSVKVILSGAFSVGQATNLDWDLPLTTGDIANGYREAVVSTSFAFSTPPDTQTDVAVGPNLVRRFHWDVPPPNQPLTVTETITSTINVSLSPFRSKAAYPLPTVPAALEIYRSPTTLTSLPASARATAREFAQGSHSEQAVVERVANWVADTLRNNGNSILDARSVLRSRRADSGGYADAMAAYLRFLRIPVRIEYGLLSAMPLHLPLPAGSVSVPVWTLPGNKNQAYTWVEVYFPDVGWVPFDPQAEKFFVDPRHIALFTNTDSGIPVDEHGTPWYGRWTAQHVAGESPTGPSFAGGETVIVPGDGVASQVVIHSRDSFHVHLRRFRMDLKKTQLFSR